MNQRVRLTKKLLQEAMLHHLEQGSIGKVTVVALCQEAGINRSTFYRYYNEPQDVVKDMEQNILRDIQEILTGIDPNSETSYLYGMDEMFAYLYENRRSIRLLLQSMDFGLQLLENTMNTCGLMTRQTARMDEVDRQMAATFLLHGGYSLIRQWLMDEQPIPPKEFCQRVRTVLRNVYL